MAYKKFGTSDIHPNEGEKGTHVVNYHSYICDNENDVANLPDKESTAIGSLAFIMETGNLYALQSDGTWVKVGEDE